MLFLNFQLIKLGPQHFHGQFAIANWERSTWQTTTIPVGLWVNCTLVSTLLTFWPPAPPEREVCNSTSPGLIYTSTSSASGRTAIEAAEVCTRPWASVSGTLCTRCTPDSYFNCPYTSSPITLRMT